MNNDLPEAHAVAFTNFKRTDGFEVSITLRGNNGTEVLERLGKAIDQIKLDGGIPISRSAQKGFSKPLEYVEGKLCPICGEKLIYANKKDGTKFIKCSTNKYMNGQATGCTYVDWGNKPTIPERQVE